MYGLSINFCCCSIIKTPPIFDRYIVPNIDGIIYFFSALIQTSGGATQKLAYDAHGNIVGVVDGNRNSTRENLKMGKPSDILTLRPNETIIKTIKGDCWGFFGVLHSQTAGTITLTDQRILFRGSVGRDSNP